MRKWLVAIEVLVFSAVAVDGAVAQYKTLLPGGGYIIRQPGQAPLAVTPRPGGGYVIQTPGQTPSFAIPRPGGGYMIQAPGQAATYVNRMPF
jgi:hypothetical protein